MAMEDSVILSVECGSTPDDLGGALRRYQDRRRLRTARVQFESRYHWDNWYHVGGIEREVARAIWSVKGEQEMYDCLAWLYDGFPLQRKREAA